MFSVEREDFFKIGMFQDLAHDGRVAWGDVDFGCRAHRLGYQVYRVYSAIGFHDDYSIRDYSTYARRWEYTSATAVKLFECYPETQSHLPMFADKTPICWGKDPIHLVARKISRRIMSSRVAIFLNEGAITLLEKILPAKEILRPLYRWGVGSHIYRGYRNGLAAARLHNNHSQ
jgi:hypothetical protein